MSDPGRRPHPPRQGAGNAAQAQPAPTRDSGFRPAAPTGFPPAEQDLFPEQPPSPPAPPTAPHGRAPVTPGEPPGDDLARTGPSGRTSPLHIGWHTVARRALRRVTVAPPAGAGLVLGRDREHVPVPLRLFAPEPVRIALVGGVWAAQLLIFRAFALGTRVVVVTTEPRAWAGFGEHATGQYNRLTVHRGDPGAAPAGSPQTPALTVYDLGMTGPATTPPPGPWAAQLTILRRLDRPGVAALCDAQLAVLQRLGGDEAALATSALRLPPHSGQLLQSMADDVLAVIGAGADRYVSLAQTATERHSIGLPRR
ncbi:hypothetical protein [Actinoplanes teichomyceticus]|uniref:Uncharacterized protein n=1 Tax=Actinoplanes teichomyceticus TaxID=1867 RepID=A0A561WIN9_ACTTI|nr:hypothetical protein [Actinoplanes teichomyceticus]TWG23718.1 hypothetical protein FHX34_102269 [Actinoplanes teichomyceticus]GIF11758.1 hypothetical protein Ate01nite_17900 [Actinoplanes teichomyceticus]